MTEYKRISELDPKVGDVFVTNSKCGSKLRCIGEDVFAFDSWEGHVSPKPARYFTNFYKKVNPEHKKFGELSRDEKLELMTAWVDGETVELLRSGEWLKVNTPSWSFNLYYRIKPSPKIEHHDKAVCYNGEWIDLILTTTDGKPTDIMLKR